MYAQAMSAILAPIIAARVSRRLGQPVLLRPDDGTPIVTSHYVNTTHRDEYRDEHRDHATNIGTSIAPTGRTSGDIATIGYDHRDHRDAHHRRSSDTVNSAPFETALAGNFGLSLKRVFASAL